MAFDPTRLDQYRTATLEPPKFDPKKLSSLRPKRQSFLSALTEPIRALPTKEDIDKAAYTPEYKVPSGERFGPQRLKPAVAIREALGREPYAKEGGVLGALEDVMDIASVAGVLYEYAKAGVQGIRQIPKYLQYLRTKSPTEAEYWSKFSPDQIIKMNRNKEATASLQRYMKTVPKDSPQFQQAKQAISGIRKGLLKTQDIAPKVMAKVATQEAVAGLGAVPRGKTLAPREAISKGLLPKPVLKEQAIQQYAKAAKAKIVKFKKEIPERAATTALGRQLQEQMEAKEEVPLHPIEEARKALEKIYPQLPMPPAQTVQDVLATPPEEKQKAVQQFIQRTKEKFKAEKPKAQPLVEKPIVKPTETLIPKAEVSGYKTLGIEKKLLPEEFTRMVKDISKEVDFPIKRAIGQHMIRSAKVPPIFSEAQAETIKQSIESKGFDAVIGINDKGNILGVSVRYLPPKVAPTQPPMEKPFEAILKPSAEEWRTPTGPPVTPIPDRPILTTAIAEEGFAPPLVLEFTPSKQPPLTKEIISQYIKSIVPEIDFFITKKRTIRGRGLLQSFDIQFKDKTGAQTSPPSGILQKMGLKESKYFGQEAIPIETPLPKPPIPPTRPPMTKPFEAILKPEAPEWKMVTGPPKGTHLEPKFPTKKMDIQKAQKFFVESLRKQGREPTVTETSEGYISVKGFVRIPDTAELQALKDKLVTKFDVEYPYKQIGAPKTGLAVKTFLSKRTAGEQKSIKAIKDLGKFGLRQKDFTNLAFIAERPGLFKPMTELQRKLYSPAYRQVRKYFDDYFKVLQERAPETFELPWPKSQIRRLQENNLHLKEALKKAKKQTRKENLISQITQNQGVIDFLKNSRIQYVHLPVRMWMAEMFEKDPQRAQQLITGTFRSIVGRETPTIQHLVDAGMVRREEVDIRDIMASYGRYVENQIAQLDILDVGKAEGLALPAGEAPDEWISLPPRLAPALKGYKLHPGFAENLERYFTALHKGGGSISRIMSTIKMMQFYNPLILPMYDVIQAGMLGSLPAMVAHPSYVGKAIRDVALKTDNYFKATEEGLFSTPFINPLDNFMRQVDMVKKHQNNNGNYILDALKRLKEYAVKPTEMIKDVYNVSWNTAWSLDHVVRMSSRGYLIEDGFTPAEASQLAAKFHGDYASIPPETRRFLNKIFFTPTFEIAMNKVYLEMLKNAFSPKAWAGKKGKAQQKFARGLVYSAGMLFGKDALMQHGLAFERDQFSRRYSKEVDVEGRERELVVVFANPINIPLRYYHKLKFDEAESNSFMRVAKTIQSRLHPVHQWAINLVRNQGDDFKPIYNPFDDVQYQIADIMRYTTGKFIRISEGFVRGDDVLTLETQRALVDATNKLWAGILRPITFRYIRSIKDEKTAYQMKNLANEFKGVLIKDPEMSEERYLMRLRNFENRLQKLEER